MPPVSRLDQADRLLRQLEWSSWRDGVPLEKGAVGIRCAACPECWGVAPDYYVESYFPVSAIGHARSCKLGQYLTTYKDYK